MKKRYKRWKHKFTNCVKGQNITPWATHPVIGVSVRARNDYADCDYVHELKGKDLEFFRAFHSEYHNGDFQHKLKKVHDTVDLKRNCWRLDNAKKRCVYSRSKYIGNLFLIKNDTSLLSTTEDDLIDLIDRFPFLKRAYEL